MAGTRSGRVTWCSPVASLEIIPEIAQDSSPNSTENAPLNMSGDDLSKSASGDIGMFRGKGLNKSQVGYLSKKSFN